MFGSIILLVETIQQDWENEREKERGSDKTGYVAE